MDRNGSPHHLGAYRIVMRMMPSEIAAQPALNKIKRTASTE
jgi:hypothetical protein